MANITQKFQDSLTHSGLNDQQAAYYLGTSRQSIYRWKKGKREPELTHIACLRAIAKSPAFKDFLEEIVQELQFTGTADPIVTSNPIPKRPVGHPKAKRMLYDMTKEEQQVWHCEHSNIPNERAPELIWDNGWHLPENYTPAPVAPAAIQGDVDPQGVWVDMSHLNRPRL